MSWREYTGRVSLGLCMGLWDQKPHSYNCPWASWPSFCHWSLTSLLRYPTGCGVGPIDWVRMPRSIPFQEHTVKVEVGWATPEQGPWQVHP